MKAILFDMDGTLIDSMGAWYKADLGYLKKQGVDVSKVDYNLLVTAGMEQAIDLLQESLPESLDLEESRDYAVSYMRNFYSKEVRPKAGVREMLSYFSSKGIPMAIGSSTPEELCEIALDTAGLRSYFDFIFSASDYDIPKDDPIFFHRVAEKFGLGANEIAVFDDAIFAIRAASEAGSVTVGVEDRSYPQNEEEVRADSDFYIDRFSFFDFEKWLEDIGF